MKKWSWGEALEEEQEKRLFFMRNSLGCVGPYSSCRQFSEENKVLLQYTFVSPGEDRSIDHTASFLPCRCKFTSGVAREIRMVIDGLPGGRRESFHLLHGDLRGEGTPEGPSKTILSLECWRLTHQPIPERTHVLHTHLFEHSALGLVSLVLCF